MFIACATAVTDELYAAVERLLPQLKFSYPHPSRKDLEALISSDSSVLLCAHYPDEHSDISGLLTLMIYRVPSGIRAHLEDIVVDEAVRGQGIGEVFVRHALGIAREASVNGVVLTTNPRTEGSQSALSKDGI